MKMKKMLSEAAQVHGTLSFGDLITVIEAFGFRWQRVRKPHYIFAHPKVPELVAVQLRTKRNRFQIKQFLSLVKKHKLQQESE